MNTPYDCRTVANAFLYIASEEDRSLTNMHLQKLIYFAHGYYMAIMNEPLIEETIEAWKHGPVIRGLYHDLKGYGGDAIDSYFKSISTSGAPTIRIVNESDLQFLRSVYDALREYGARELSQLTHAADSPWRAVYDGRNTSKSESPEIGRDEITSYFQKLIYSSNSQFVEKTVGAGALENE